MTRSPSTPAARAAEIPLALPEIGAQEEDAVIAVMRSGELAMGEQVAALEEAWAEYCGVANAVFMANGTLALEAVLHTLGLGPGDEVITVSFSFTATVSAILRVGASPVLVDVGEDDFCIDPNLVEAAVTPRTRAIMPVHLYGLPADMDPLRATATKHGLALIEDAAQAIGARYRGRSVGGLGTAAVFSLYATKAITSGEGGMVTTDDGQIARRLRLFRNQGMETRHRHVELGTNLRPTEIAAAMARPQLARIDVRTSRRRQNAARLSAGLTDQAVPRVPEGREHAWHQYTLRLASGRDQIADHLRERGIGTGIYYRLPIHRQPFIRRHLPDLRWESLLTTDRLASEVLSLPVRASLGDAEVDAIVQAVRDVTSHHAA